MGRSWVNSEGAGLDLHLDLAGADGVRAALMRALREAISTGRLAPGTTLPPYRSLAADLGIARNTVADAYAELVAEGWLAARQGSGTRVAERATPLPPERTSTPRRPASPPRYSLRPGSPDPSEFPRAAWLAATRRALGAAPAEAFGPQDERGRIELRTVLVDYLARARGVRTDPDRIVICAGFTHALHLLGAVLAGHRPTAPIGVEAYSLWLHRQILTTSGVPTLPLTIDEDGAQVGRLAGTAAAAVLLTTAHQYPTGGPLHPERRAAVIDWARRTGGLVLEDDYDGEFRYDRQPVGAVQGLDPDRVCYLGSVSKSLSPALRLGWMVLPDHLVDPVLTAKGPREHWVSGPDQLTLAEFLASGAYDRQVRRMRQRYRRRRDLLVDTLTRRAPHVRVTGIAAGLHAVLTLPPGTEDRTVAACAADGLAVEGIGSYRHPDTTMPGYDGLVVGYGTPPEHAFPNALDVLCRNLPG